MKCKLINYFCYFQFLTEEAAERLGKERDTGAIRRHPFFNKTDWEAVQNRCLKPPIRPKIQRVSGKDSVFISYHKLLQVLGFSISHYLHFEMK